MSALAVYTTFSAESCAQIAEENTCPTCVKDEAVGKHTSCHWVAQAGFNCCTVYIAYYLYIRLLMTGMFLGFLLYLLVFFILFSLAGFMLNAFITGCF